MRFSLNSKRVFLGLALGLIFVGSAMPADTELTKEQMQQFLLTAKVVAQKHTKKGITDPWRLTLSDGTTTHEAVFQAIDEHKASMQFSDGHTELNFVDSYKYNVAAYQLAELIGMDNMIPVYVERKWNGSVGSMSWVVPVKMDEEERLRKKVSSPDSDAWNKQMYKIRIFDELVFDTDPNLTNVLISDDWKIWRVDFSRAFRLNQDVGDYKNLVKCDKQLLEKLKALQENELALKTKGFLTKPEVHAVMVRRDKIVAYFEKLIAQKGQQEVLY
jgi:hypothetical protein